MPVVRISLGRFDAANYDAVRKLLDDSQKTLIPAIGALKGNRAYYVGRAPSSRPPMIVHAPTFELVGQVTRHPPIR